jgi:Protein of unknown function (DUF2971)
MSIYKYVSSKAGLHYLRNWRLRLSPTSALNDPFEFGLVLAESYENAFSAQSEALYAEIDKQLGRTREERIAQWRQSDVERGIKGVSLTEAVREAYKVSLGVLCLTRTQRHLLMWSHYADGHRGMLLEFDEEHPSFRRSIPGTHFQGRLIPVTYSDTRPTVKNRTADAFAKSLSAKALEWAYEQEVRMFLPLSEAELTSLTDSYGAPIHLLEVPSDALKGVTLGCLSDDVATVRSLLIDAAPHVAVATARLDVEEYRLHYSAAD